jgi:hypothetical protein
MHSHQLTDIVGTCDKLDNPAAPVWSKVHLTNAEALGATAASAGQSAGPGRPAPAVAALMPACPGADRSAPARHSGAAVLPGQAHIPRIDL